MIHMTGIQGKHRDKSNLLPENTEGCQIFFTSKYLHQHSNNSLTRKSSLFLNIVICLISFYLFINLVANLSYFSQFLLRQWREAAISSADLFPLF